MMDAEYDDAKDGRAPVVIADERLCKAQARLHEVIDTLVKRLEYVLRPSPPADSERPAALDIVRPERSPHVAALEARLDAIEEETTRLVRLIDRVDV